MKNKIDLIKTLIKARVEKIAKLKKDIELNNKVDTISAKTNETIMAIRLRKAATRARVLEANKIAEKDKKEEDKEEDKKSKESNVEAIKEEEVKEKTEEIKEIEAEESKSKEKAEEEIEKIEEIEEKTEEKIEESKKEDDKKEPKSDKNDDQDIKKLEEKVKELEKELDKKTTQDLQTEKNVAIATLLSLVSDYVDLEILTEESLNNIFNDFSIESILTASTIIEKLLQGNINPTLDAAKVTPNNEKSVVDEEVPAVLPNEAEEAQTKEVQDLAKEITSIDLDDDILASALEDL